MKSWDQVRIGTTTLNQIEKMVFKNVDKNPACKFISYWDGNEGELKSMSREIKSSLFNSGQLPYGYVGDGWPYRKDQSWVIPYDWLSIMGNFSEQDFNTRDVGDTIYQTNILEEYFKEEKHLAVMDFGSGYGRLAVGFIFGSAKLAQNLTYFGVDYVPVSLLIAPQFVYQTTLANSDGLFFRRNHGNGRFFHSVPAWEIEEIRVPIDLFITVHSFQEMTLEACKYYIEVAEKLKSKNAMFYSVNIEGKHNWVPKSWEGVFVHEYPSVNRDGMFYEKLWRMK